MQISFFVDGLPQTAGSKRGFAIKKGGMYTGNVAMMDANPKTKLWQAEVKQAARVAYFGNPTDQPISLMMTFWMPRPKYHFLRGVLRKNAPAVHTFMPDVLKLGRAIEDALTGVIYEDDAQIYNERLRKFYVSENRARPGVDVDILWGTPTLA